MNIRCLILLLCVCKCVMPCSAQQYFNVRDPLHGLFAQLSTVTEYNNKYYCTGWVDDSINYVGPGPGGSSYWYFIGGIKFVAFDKSGQKLIDTFYQQRGSRSYEPGFGKLMPYNSGFLCLVRAIDSGNISHMQLLCFDTLGRVKWFREYDKPICTHEYEPQRSFWQAVDIKPDLYGNWLLLSTCFCQTGVVGGYGKMLLTKLDYNFNIIWNKDYGDNAWNSIACKVIVDSSGYMVAGNLDNNHQNQTNIKSGIELFKTDTSGNTLWHFTKISDSCNDLRDIIRTSDGNFVYCGAGVGKHEVWQNGFQETVYKVLWIQKIDSTGRSLWQYSPSPIYFTAWAGLTNIMELPSNDIVTAGCVASGFTIADSIYKNNALGALVCINKDGKPKWRRAYSFDNNVDTLVHQIYDLKHTTDGGFIMCGMAQASIKPGGIDPIQRGWLLKVDSNGCTSLTDPQCHPTAVPHSPQATSAFYEVYPNPVAELLSIRYVNNSEGTCFLLTDMTGKLLHRIPLRGTSGKEEVDTKSLVPGVYFYHFTSGDGRKLASGKLIKK